MAGRLKGAKGLSKAGRASSIASLKAGRGSSKGVFNAGKVVGSVQDVSVNPYVQRLAQDPDLRDNLRQAYESARSAYGRLADGKAPSKVIDDKKFQRDLSNAASSLRDAGDALRSGPKRSKKGRRGGALLVVGLVGAGAAVALSEGLRSKILDALFGSEEEFEYTSTTTSTPAAETVSAS